MSFPELICRACGHKGHDVQPRIIRDLDSDRYHVEPRCIDHEACEARQYARSA